MAGAWLAQYARARFGRETTVQQKTFTAGTSALEAMQVNPRRFAFCMFNLSVVSLNFGFDVAANATNGFPLQGLGGGVCANADEDGELVGHSIWVIAPQASCTMVIAEVLGV